MKFFISTTTIHILRTLFNDLLKFFNITKTKYCQKLSIGVSNRMLDRVDLPESRRSGSCWKPGGHWKSPTLEGTEREHFLADLGRSEPKSVGRRAKLHPIEQRVRALISARKIELRNKGKDRFREFRPELALLYLGGFSPTFARDLLCDVFPQMAGTPGVHTVNSAYDKICNGLMQGDLVNQLDPSGLRLLEDHQTGPWDPEAPPWLRTVFKLPESSALTGKGSAANEATDKAGDVSIPGILTPPTPICDDIEVFVRQWELLKRVKPSLGEPTTAELRVGISKGIDAVLTMREKLELADSGTTPETAAYPSVSQDSLANAKESAERANDSDPRYIAATTDDQILPHEITEIPAPEEALAIAVDVPASADDPNSSLPPVFPSKIARPALREMAALAGFDEWPPRWSEEDHVLYEPMHELLCRPVDSLILDAHHTFFPELPEIPLEANPQISIPVIAWKEITEGSRPIEIPQGFRLFGVDDAWHLSLAMSGYTPADCHGAETPGIAWISTLVAEGIVERAFGLAKGAESPSGRRYLQYGQLWTETLARKMLEMDCPNWFYVVNPYRVEQRKPERLEDLPEGCTWIPGWGLYPTSYLQRVLEIDRRGTGYLSNDEELQRNEAHFYGKLAQALGPAGAETNSRIFRYRKPKWQGFVPFAFGANFHDDSKDSADWLNFNKENVWSGSNPGAEPLMKALATIPTAIHRRSADDAARAISAAVWKRRQDEQP